MLAVWGAKTQTGRNYFFVKEDESAEYLSIVSGERSAQLKSPRGCISMHNTVVYERGAEKHFSDGKSKNSAKLRLRGLLLRAACKQPVARRTLRSITQ